MRKKWADAEARYKEIVARFPDSKIAPEAIYWKGICRYKQTNDHKVLSEVPEQLKEKYADSVWALKATVWIE